MNFNNNKKNLFFSIPPSLSNKTINNLDEISNLNKIETRNT